MTKAATADAEIDADVKTIADLPFPVMGRFPKPVTLGRCRADEVIELSSKEVFERIRDLSLGFRSLGVSRGDRVAIVSESRPEWLLSDLAVLTAGAVTVPIYPTLSAGQGRYILQDSGTRLALVSTRLQPEKVQEDRPQLPALEAVVVMDAATAASAGTPSVLSLEEVERRGHTRMTGEWGAAKGFRDDARTVKPDDLATIIYTSGTTGEPKGVMLTHNNLVSNMRATSEALDISQDDVALSFLPLSHGFERMVSYVYLFCGVTIVFAESFDTIARDLARVRPTILTGVPRVYEKLHTRIIETARTAGGSKAAIFRWAVNAGLARAKAVLRGRSAGPVTSLKTAIGDRFVFTAIREKMGGRIRFVALGRATVV